MKMWGKITDYTNNNQLGFLIEIGYGKGRWTFLHL